MFFEQAFPVASRTIHELLDARGICGAASGLSLQRSGCHALRLYLAAIQRPSGEDASLLPFFGIHYHPKPEHLEKGSLWRWFYALALIPS